MSKVSQAYIHAKFVSTYEPKLVAAYYDNIVSIKSLVDRKALLLALSTFDVDGAIRALNLTVDNFGLWYSAMLEANLAILRALQADMVKGPLAVGLSVSLQENVTGDVAADVAQLVASLANGAQRAILAGYRDGLRPVQIAKRLVGGAFASNSAISNAVKASTGGVLGLSEPQLIWIDDAGRELRQVPPSRNYFKRKLRDIKLDKLVAEAIRQGKALSPTVIGQIMAGYADRVIKEMARRAALRAVMKAANGNRLRLILSALAGKDINHATKEWVTMGDNKVRHTHKAMNGQRVNIVEPFTSPSGALLAYPHDSAGGLSETSGCRCWFRARYKGKFI